MIFGKYRKWVFVFGFLPGLIGGALFLNKYRVRLRTTSLQEIERQAVQLLEEILLEVGYDTSPTKWSY